MGKTTAQKGAHVVKDGIRHKDVYATAVGDITKAYFLILSHTHIWKMKTTCANAVCPVKQNVGI